MRFTARRGVALAIVGAALMGAGIAYATIPDGNGLIHGCVKKNGDLYVVDSDAGGACRGHDQTLNWDQQGQATGGSPVTFNVAPAATFVPNSAYGPTTDVLTFGPFTLKVSCNQRPDASEPTFDASLLVSSTDGTAGYVSTNRGPGNFTDNVDENGNGIITQGGVAQTGQSPSMLLGQFSLASPATGVDVIGNYGVFMTFNDTPHCRFFGTVTPA
jgi:hypothetical protein